MYFLCIVNVTPLCLLLLHLRQWQVSLEGVDNDYVRDYTDSSRNQ